MAEGTLDPTGVWLYGEDDERDTFSALLNIGQEATADAIAADRARLGTLEAGAALGVVNGAAFTSASGWNISSQTARRKAGLVFWNIVFGRGSGGVTVPADGNIADQDIATLNAGWAAASGMSYPAAYAGVGAIAGGLLFGSAGVLRLTAVAPGVTIPTGSTFSLCGVYPLA